MLELRRHRSVGRPVGECERQAMKDVMSMLSMLMSMLQLQHHVSVGDAPTKTAGRARSMLMSIVDVDVEVPTLINRFDSSTG